MSKIITVILTGLLFILGCQKLDLGEKSYIGGTRIGDGLQVNIKQDQIKLQVEGKISSEISGKLMPLENRSSAIFTLKERPDIEIVMSPDNLIIIGTKEYYPKFGIGIANTKKSFEINDIAGLYNFVLQYHSQNKNRVSFGTFELGPDKSWRSWRFKNGVGKDEPIVNGHWVDSGKGEILAFTGDRLFATLAFSEDGNDLLIINLLERNGIALGVKRKAIDPNSVNGDYSVLGSKGNGMKTASIRDQIVFQGKKKLDLLYNEPYEGFFRDSKGEILGVFSANGTCFGINIGALSGSQFIFAAVKK